MSRSSMMTMAALAGLTIATSGCSYTKAVGNAYMAHVREDTTFGRVFLKPAHEASKRDKALAEWQRKWDAMEEEMRTEHTDYDHIVYKVFEPALAGSELLKREFLERGTDPVAAYDLGRRLVIEQQIGIPSSSSVGSPVNGPVRLPGKNSQNAVDATIKPNAYGLGVHSNQYGQPIKLVPDGGGAPGEPLRLKTNVYGPGVHMDQYGRPVREVPAFGN